MPNVRLAAIISLLSLSLLLQGCFIEPSGGRGGGGQPQLSGSVLIDGSSTVFPITEAVSEEFNLVQRKVRVTVGISGTGGGFQKFCNGETIIQDASRPIS